MSGLPPDLSQKPQIRVRDREQAQDLGHVPGFRGVRPEELASRRHLCEEVAGLDRGSPRVAGVPHVDEAAVLDLDLGAGDSTFLAGLEHEVGHARDRGQGLAPKAAGGERVEVRELPQLRGRVALGRELGVGARHALAVVGHADEALASAFDLDPDLSRLGVERVLDQLLHHRSRPLDHLPGRDLVDEVVREPLDRS